MNFKQGIAALGVGLALGAGGAAGVMAQSDKTAKPTLRNFQLSVGEGADGGAVWFGQACGELPRGDGTSETQCWDVTVPVNAQLELQLQR